MYGLQNGEQALHKEAAPRRVERNEEDIKKMKGFFSSGLMIDTFIHDPDAHIIIPTRVVLPYLICSQALFCPEPCPQCRERPAANAFVKKHINQINSNTVGFWEPIPNTKTKTFSNANL